MPLSRRKFICTGLVSAGALWTFGNARAEAANTIRFGHLTDMSGVYRDVEGPTSLACLQQAVEEFSAANPSIKIEIFVADHQNKADIGLRRSRKPRRSPASPPRSAAPVGPCGSSAPTVLRAPFLSPFSPSLAFVRQEQAAADHRITAGESSCHKAMA